MSLYSLMIHKFWRWALILYANFNSKVDQVLTIEELLPNKYRRKWRIGKKPVYPGQVDIKPEHVFSESIDSKLPKKVLSTLRSWLNTVKHAMWGGKDYHTFDSLTRILYPEEVLVHFTSSLYMYVINMKL